MRAIVEINGKQYEVEEGRYVQIDSYNADVDQEIVLGNVCMVVAGDKSLMGAPYVEGATVKTRIRRHDRGPKILIYKMRCKKGYRRKNGHRQGFTELQVVQIDFTGRDAFGPVPQAQAPVDRTLKAVETPVAAPKKTKVPKAATVETATPVEKPKAKKTAAPKAEAVETPIPVETAAPQQAEAPKAETVETPVQAETPVTEAPVVAPAEVETPAATEETKAPETEA